MSMENDAPVLSAAQWASLRAGTGLHVDDFDGAISLAYSHDYDDVNGRGVTLVRADNIVGVFLAGAVRALMAVANDSLPDVDPRKITRERVEELRALAVGNPAASTTVSALESLLPPREMKEPVRGEQR